MPAEKDYKQALIEKTGQTGQSFDPDDEDLQLPEHISEAEDHPEENTAIEDELEYREDLKNLIFSGVPMGDQGAMNVSTYFGAIEAAHDVLSSSGEGVYAPTDPAGKAILAESRNRIRADGFGLYHQLEINNVVKGINSSPVSSFEFVTQPDGSFALVEKPTVQSDSGGGSLQQDLDAGNEDNLVTSNVSSGFTG